MPIRDGDSQGELRFQDIGASKSDESVTCVCPVPSVLTAQRLDFGSPVAPWGHSSMRKYTRSPVVANAGWKQPLLLDVICDLPVPSRFAMNSLQSGEYLPCE